MRSPRPRGVLSERVLNALCSGRVDSDLPTLRADHADDAQLALWVLYELHYRGFDDVSDDLEWHPTLLRVRHRLEKEFENELRSRYESPTVEGNVAEALFDYIDAHDGPSLSTYVQRDATRDQVLDLLSVRSVYHLKEADPVAWVVPRVGGAAGVALMSVQYDEYGAGDYSRLHSQLFATGMAACGLAVDRPEHVEGAPMEVLAQNNAMSIFGLHRRLRGAALGHLAAFEATSSLPSRRMLQGLRRVGLPDAMQAYYDEHVEADAVHEQLVIRQVCGELLRTEPGLVDDVFWGAHTCLDLESRMATRMLERWTAAPDEPADLLAAPA
jgi:hypothetical protein